MCTWATYRHTNTCITKIYFYTLCVCYLYLLYFYTFYFVLFVHILHYFVQVVTVGLAGLPCPWTKVEGVLGHPVQSSSWSLRGSYNTGELEWSLRNSQDYFKLLRNEQIFDVCQFWVNFLQYSQERRVCNSTQDQTDG